MTDVLILPDMKDMQLRDWENYDASVEAGYKAAKAALDASDLKTKSLPA
jgi:NTE family protein